jgi:glycosyltransferase involved in cell wall biosynthesis
MDAEAVCGAMRPPVKVVRLITGLEIGGAELGLLESLCHFDRKRFQFVVGCLYNNGSVGRQIEGLGIRVFDMRMRSFGDPAGLLRLWRFLRAERPDILHTHLFRANVWGRLLGRALRVPVIISHEHSVTRGRIEGRRRTWLLSAIDAGTARCCDKIIAVSEAVKKCLVENSIPGEKVEVVLNSIDTSVFATAAGGAAIRGEFGLQGAALVTIVARLAAGKNHALLLEAFRLLHVRRAEARLLIVGSGPLESALRAQAESMAPGAVKFAGTRTDIPAIMAASDVVVLCSERETFGRVLVEAMASAKPVIGTAVDGIPEVIADGQTGILVAPGDCSALAAAMETLLADRELATRMGRAGQARARELFDIRRSVERCQTMYSELYAKRTAGNHAGLPRRQSDPAAPTEPATGLVPVRHHGKPRILYIITRAERGGAQMHLLNLACAMRQDFEVALATGEEGYLTEECREKSIPVYLLPHLQRQVWPLSDAVALWEIQRLIARIQPDLIHAHTFKAGFLGRLASYLRGVPSVYTIHSWLFGTPALPRLWGLLGAPCERLAARWCNRLITVSEAGASLARKHRVAPQAKIVTIHNGIRDCPERAALDHGQSPVIIMVARFTEVKEHDVLLRAFASLPSGPRLRFLGDGPLRENSEKLARELGISGRVEFLGDREDVASLLAASDLFVLVTKFEMFSLSILEAMRAGLPVIASDVGGNCEAVEHGKTGFLVPAGSVTGLAEALRLVLGNPDLRLSLGRAARQRFTERFLFAYQEQNTRSVYQDILRESHRVTSSG